MKRDGKWYTFSAPIVVSTGSLRVCKVVETFTEGFFSNGKKHVSMFLGTFSVINQFRHFGHVFTFLNYFHHIWYYFSHFGLILIKIDLIFNFFHHFPSNLNFGQLHCGPQRASSIFHFLEFVDNFN